MGLSDLQAWLISNAGFKRHFEPVVLESVRKQFPVLADVAENSNGRHDWQYLLMCASILASSNREDCQDAALRIAHHCLQNPSGTQSEKDAAALILDSLNNNLSIQLAEKRSLLSSGFSERLPFPMFQDHIRRSVIYSIALANEAVLHLNRFQRSFWNAARENDWLSLSAPTSAGKSYILLHWLIEFLRRTPRSMVVYLVPTRALIQQVANDIRKHLTREGVTGVSVTVLPLKKSLNLAESNVLVFTQERFHVLLSALDHNLLVDLLIIDEAHKVGDGYRGVLLQQVIESVSAQNAHTKILFASPLTENPRALLEDASPSIRSTELISEDTMVNQNLLWVSQRSGRPKEWALELCLPERIFKIGEFSTRYSPDIQSKRLSFMAYALGSPEGGNLIYVNGPGEAEKMAIQLFDLLRDGLSQPVSPKLTGLIELVKKVVHPQYVLANVLEGGIGFHYGNMPLLIRTEIEELFTGNIIKYLVCTSTLMEGMNLPCRNIFVRGPQKGKGKPMNAGDFWNLAGRAGRWGQEFQGNIVCVDAHREDVWKGEAPRRRTRYKITRTADKILSQPEQLLEFIRNGTPRNEAKKSPELEYVFAYLVASYLRFESIGATPWAKRFRHDLIEELEIRIGEVCRNLKTPPKVVLRNPGISPLAMDKVLDFFLNYSDPIEPLIPVSVGVDNALAVYNKILLVTNSHLGEAFGLTEKRVFMLALLIVNWMRGETLANLISGRIKYLRRREREVKISNVIRETMTDVEQIARFEAPKYLACYVDLLRVHMKSINREEMLISVPNLNVILEFGVSQGTQLSLMGLGLSRTTTLAISELIANENLSEEECLEWLRTYTWATASLPALVKEEVQKLIGAEQGNT